MINKDRLTPVELETLLRCYYSGDVNLITGTSGSHTQALDALEDIGAIEVERDIETIVEVNATAMGVAWAESILRTPLPTLAYIDAAGNVIKV